MSTVKEIVLNPTDYLVEHLPDYYKPKDNKFSTHIREYDELDVGHIVKVGEDLPLSHEGRILYFRKDIGFTVEVSGIGRFMLVPDAHKIMVRMDQNKYNY